MQNNVLPPKIIASQPNTFANFAMAIRKLQIIDLVLNSNDFIQSVSHALLALKTEVSTGRVQQIKEDAVDRKIWDQDLNLWIGKHWVEMPWLLAEAYFYRRVLEATGYFQPGLNKELDPFDSLKKQGMKEGLEVFSKLYPDLRREETYKNFLNFSLKSLWGNRDDLSITAEFDQEMSQQTHRIIIDQSYEAFLGLQANKSNSIAYFLDNVGRELFFDLALIDFLLETELARQVTCYLKSQPFYVSDVMIKDFYETLDLLKMSGSFEIQKLALRIQTRMDSGRIKLEAPLFLTYGREYHQMPDSFKTQLSTFNLSILKGDLNYRRIMRDRYWPFTTPVEIAAGYFPTSFIIFRTLKSEIVVGLTDAILAKIESESDPDWLTNGKRGLISFYQK